MSSPLLEVSHLAKRFGGIVATDDVSFAIPQGELHALIGPNGAGKTTLIAQLSGSLFADSGAIQFAGADITRLPMYLRARAGMGYLAQDSSVFRQLSVEDNLKAILETRKDLSRKQRKERLNELLDRFGLTKIRKTQAHRVSGGERRRTEIARSLITNPKLIMLDEPFAGIDPKTVGEIQEQIRDLVDTYNIGILLQTIDQTLAQGHRGREHAALEALWQLRHQRLLVQDDRDGRLDHELGRGAVARIALGGQDHLRLERLGVARLLLGHGDGAEGVRALGQALLEELGGDGDVHRGLAVAIDDRGQLARVAQATGGAGAEGGSGVGRKRGDVCSHDVSSG